MGAILDFVLEIKGFGVAVLVLKVNGLSRWAGVSGEEGFGCRMERVWRLG